MFSSFVCFFSSGIESHESWRYRYFVPVMDREMFDRIEVNFHQLRRDTCRDGQTAKRIGKCEINQTNAEATRTLIDITISRFLANPIYRKFVGSLITFLVETRAHVRGWMARKISQKISSCLAKNCII